MDDDQLWKLLDQCRVESDNIGGTSVAFAYEALAQAVGQALKDERRQALRDALDAIPPCANGPGCADEKCPLRLAKQAIMALGDKAARS
jgi:hypothetical protein